MSLDGRPSGTALALALALALGASVAHAEDAAPAATVPGATDDGPSRARALFQRGVTLAQEERWAEAEQAFAESEAIVPRPNTAYDRALALYRLGRLREMLVELDRFVSQSDPVGDAEDRTGAERLRHTAEATLATLTVRVTPPGAVVDVDREALRGHDTERSLRVDPGEHVVVARAPGFRDERRALRLAAGEQAHLVLALALEASPERPGPEPGRTGVTASSAPRAVTPSRTGPIILAVLGGAGLAGAAITGALAGSLDRQIRERCTGSVCPADLSDDQSHMLTLATASDVLLIGGASLVGAGVTWWLLAPTPAPGTTAALSLVPAGARLGGTF